jgi:hypothetical protein
MRDSVAADNLRDGSFAPQVHMLEDVLWVALNITQVFQVARVGQAVEVDQSAYFRLVDDVSDQVGPDKPCTACHQ